MTEGLKISQWKWPEACALAEQMMDDQQFQLLPGSIFHLDGLHATAAEIAKTDPILAAALLLKIADRLHILEDFPGDI